MNLTSTSEYDNVSEDSENYSKSLIHNAIYDLLNINNEVTLFCPLCVNSFEYKFTLLEHLKTFHSNFLIKAENKKLRFNGCPFCNVKFYGKHLIAKHCLLFHSKLIKEFLVDGNWMCIFCGNKLKKDYQNIVNHIQEMHFLTFEEEFKKKFCCGRTLVINMSHTGNNSENFKTDSNCVSLKNFWLTSNIQNSGKKSEKSINMKDFKDASKINCYDFTDLKEQLEKINTPLIKPSSLKKKRSILKDTKNLTPRKSVRRVLRFDLADSCNENKEDSVLMCNLKNINQINIEEHSLLCNNDIDKFHKNSYENWYEKPIHSSTPNAEEICMIIKDNNKKKNFKKTTKSFFKSYVNQSFESNFQFQCGKCRRLFKENLELVCHIKNNHKKLGLKDFQPCYRCAVCSAKFFRNHYLKKHHRLHKLK